MRNFGLITSLALISLFAVITACVLDPTEHQPTKEAQSDELSRSTVDDPAAPSRVASAEQALSTGATENAITPVVTHAR